MILFLFSICVGCSFHMGRGVSKRVVKVIKIMLLSRKIVKFFKKTRFLLYREAPST